jgi:S1-C subfamily serine protease
MRATDQPVHRVFLAVLTAAMVLALAAASKADHPYSAVCVVEIPSIGHYGSGTLIGVAGDQALVLSCAHVCTRVDAPVTLKWPVTGDVSTGRVLARDARVDLAVIICRRPPNTRPVDMRSARPGERLVNVGYPSYDRAYPGWQVAQYRDQGPTTLTYNALPFPGMSGGATFGVDGKLVGVVVWYARDETHGGSVSYPAIEAFTERYRR